MTIVLWWYPDLGHCSLVAEGSNTHGVEVTKWMVGGTVIYKWNHVFCTSYLHVGACNFFHPGSHGVYKYARNVLCNSSVWYRKILMTLTLGACMRVTVVCVSVCYHAYCFIPPRLYIENGAVKLLWHSQDMYYVDFIEITLFKSFGDICWSPLPSSLFLTNSRWTKETVMASFKEE